MAAVPWLHRIRADAGRGSYTRGMLTARKRWRRARSSGRWQLEIRGAQPDAGRPGGWTVWRRGQTPKAASGKERQSSQSGQRTTELVLPGPALGKMQGEAAGRAGDASGQREEASSEGLGGYHLLAQTDARRPAGQVMGRDLHRQPGGVGGGTARLRDLRSLGILENPRVGGFT